MRVAQDAAQARGLVGQPSAATAGQTTAGQTTAGQATAGSATPANRVAAARPHTPRSYYRAPHLRWVARRPPEAIVTRRPRRPSGPRPIPRYGYLPRWGLRDLPVVATTEREPELESRDRLQRALLLAGGTLTAAALAHLFRYVLTMINRSKVLPQWLIDLSGGLVVVCGLAGLIGFVVATAAFTRWVIDLRAAAYASVDRTDPRHRRWIVVPLAAIPLVNVIGAPMLILEAAAVRTDLELDAVLVRARLKKVWLAWTLVTVVAIIAVVMRIVDHRSGTIQSGADAVAMVMVSSAVSAAFAFWFATRLPRLFTAAPAAPVPDRRWVVVS
ncbi:DUF4328 domain-containing protein [Gordonia sp. ABSL1-1]|uniref:DUF4328 domain-containing protein n=1 Tax=Gordonia sp. ABSL1-1 TaxID=3053923 RepID=UPI002573B425|nr:DUF4328 domain-containing protein [Gordonia sp. ABSL1-1]MDL9937618.1 DUF4328 domain-containing protein [Gordonia sp. ABSL1-1]